LKNPRSALHYFSENPHPEFELDGNRKMCQLDRLQRLKAEIYRIAQRHNARKVYVFGSCARKEETPESDIDLLVEFNNASLFDHIRLEEEIAELLQSSVDIVSLKALKQDSFGRQVRQEMVLL